MKFKAGDRVAVYCQHLNIVGARGTILSVSEIGFCHVKLDQATAKIAETVVLARDCRKLVKRKKQRAPVPDKIERPLTGNFISLETMSCMADMIDRINFLLDWVRKQEGK